jgi:hypothetical protein
VLGVLRHRDRAVVPTLGFRQAVDDRGGWRQIPVVQLRKVVPGGAADVFVKLEWFNPTGSYKDRMARNERYGHRSDDTGLKYLAGDLFRR